MSACLCAVVTVSGFSHGTHSNGSNHQVHILCDVPVVVQASKRPSHIGVTRRQDTAMVKNASTVGPSCVFPPSAWRVLSTGRVPGDLPYGERRISCVIHRTRELWTGVWARWVWRQSTPAITATTCDWRVPWKWMLSFCAVTRHVGKTSRFRVGNGSVWHVKRAMLTEGSPSCEIVWVARGMAVECVSQCAASCRLCGASGEHKQRQPATVPCGLDSILPRVKSLWQPTPVLCRATCPVVMKFGMCGVNAKFGYSDGHTQNKIIDPLGYGPRFDIF